MFVTKGGGDAAVMKDVTRELMLPGTLACSIATAKEGWIDEGKKEAAILETAASAAPEAVLRLEIRCMSHWNGGLVE